MLAAITANFAEQVLEEGAIKQSKAVGELSARAAAGDISVESATSQALKGESTRLIQNATAREAFSWQTRSQQYEYAAKDYRFASEDVTWNAKQLQNRASQHSIDAANLTDSASINKKLQKQYKDSAVIGAGAKLIGGAGDFSKIGDALGGFIGGLFGG